MIKDIFDSFKDNLKERTTNPFLGTFVIVWVVKNWRVVYSLFYFDKEFKLQQRLDYIASYFNGHSFVGNLFTTALYTLLVLLITYNLLTISRLLVNLYDKIVTPMIYRITDKSSVVLKSDYNDLITVIASLEAKLEDERQSKSRVQEERDLLDKRLAEFIASANSNEKEFEAIVDKIADINEISHIDNYFKYIYARVWLSKGTELSNLLLKEELIEVENINDNDQVAYKFTDKGRSFVKFWDKIKDTYVEL